MPWNAISIKVDKNYGYIVKILKAIFDLHIQYHAPIPLRNIERRKRVGSAVTPQGPPDTPDITLKTNNLLFRVIKFINVVDLERSIKMYSQVD